MGRFVSGVVPDVRRQSSVIYERLSAELTDVRSLSGVDPLVTPQRAEPRKGFAADAAAVRFDAGVTPHVSLDVLVGFTADVADFPSISVTLQVVCQGF